jgi:hypothetical protein
MPGGMGTQNLPRAVGERRAKELILSARPFSAAEGLAWGLVNRICEPAMLLEEALATAQAIAGNAPLSVRQAKKSIHYGLQMDLLTGYRYELPSEKLEAAFTQESVLALSTAAVPTRTQVSSIIGEERVHTLYGLRDHRQSEVDFHLAKLVLETYFTDKDNLPKPWLFPSCWASCAAGRASA